jgi:formamidopyrimidine-DNA glycosylase
MPELPDVEVFKGYLDATALHQEITEVAVRSRQILGNISSQKLKDHLENRQFESTRRHGKYLFVHLDSGSWLVVHFGMTGFLKYFRDMDHEPEHARLLVNFANGYHLAYDSQRKLGEVGVVEDMQKFIEKKKLGPDALDPALDFNAFSKAFLKSRAMIKSALMNQGLVAGIGNIYSDEILFQAGIHPRTKVTQLKEEDQRKLFDAMKEVLQVAIAHRMNPEEFPNHYFLPHRRKGEECPRCHGEIDTVKISGRTAYYCPRCQQK